MSGFEDQCKRDLAEIADKYNKPILCFSEEQFRNQYNYNARMAYREILDLGIQAEIEHDLNGYARLVVLLPIKINKINCEITINTDE